MQTRTRSLPLIAGAAFGLFVSAAWAQPTDTPPPPNAPARQPGDQRPARPEGQPGQEGRGREGRGGGTGDITSVNGAMKAINRGFRQLRDQIADPEKKEENLKIVGDIEKAIVAAKSMPVPAERRGGPGGPGRGPSGGEGGGPKGPGGGGGGAGGGAHEEPGGRLVEDQNEAPKTQPQGDAPKAQPKEGEPKPAAPADPKRTEDFRRDLVKLLKQTIEIEQDLLDGKFDQAKTDMGKIPELRDDAHKELGVRQGRG